MPNPSIYLCLFVFATVLIVVESASKYESESFTCRLLESKYVDSQPWTEYPIVFEPINRGRLTIWSGITTLPGSEFRCLAGTHRSGAIILDFANYFDKLEWTFYDINKGITHHGISVNQRENVKYKVSVDSKQLHSYTDCNTITKIELVDTNDTYSDLKTTCQDCGYSMLTMINSQIKELIKLKLNEQIMDNLRWHLTELISSQHFSGPIPLKE